MRFDNLYCFVGLTAGALGTATTITADICKAVFTDKRSDEVKAAFSEVAALVRTFMHYVNNYTDEYNEAKDYMHTNQGGMLMKIMNELYKNTLRIASTTVTVINLVHVMILLKSLHPELFLEIGCEIAKQTVTLGAEAGSGVGVAAKCFNISSRTIAKTLKFAGAAFSMAIGTWDVVWGSIELAKGNEVAQQLKETADNLETTKNHLIECYEGIVESQNVDVEKVMKMKYK